LKKIGNLETAICDSFFRDISFDEFEYLEPYYADNGCDNADE
jgi:hypothetical protein